MKLISLTAVITTFEDGRVIETRREVTEQYYEFASAGTAVRNLGYRLAQEIRETDRRGPVRFPRADHSRIGD